MPDSPNPPNQNPTSIDDRQVPDSFDDAQETRFAVLQALGEGAAGTILLAQESNLQREVALKILKPQSSGQNQALKRFLREARIIAHLDHPAIVPIYRLTVREDGQAAYAMKPVRGRTLQDLIKEARQQIDEHGKVDEAHDTPALLEHFIKVCDALHFAHVRGVLHRDIKPANIMIGPYNEVYVMDWGIARLNDGEDHHPSATDVPLEDHPDMYERTQVGTLLGTPRYMSPEQAEGKLDSMDARSDLFSLGLVLFELVSLCPALTGRNWQELSERIREVQLEPLAHYGAHQQIAVELRAIIHKATMAKPEQRYPDVAAFADDIRRYLRGEPVSVHKDSLPQRLMRWVSHHKREAFGILVALILIKLSLIGYGLYHRQQLMIAHQQQQLVMGQLLTEGGELAQDIERRFLRFETLLERLSGASIQLLTHSQPEQLTFYRSEDNAAGNGAPDLSSSAVYGTNISLDWPAIKVAPSIADKAVETQLQQLAALQPTFKHILRESFDNPPTDANEFRQRVLQQGAPLVWAYFGTQQGVLIAHPGSGTYPADYDPRQRPWYKESLDGDKIRWLPPYVDISGRGLMLPCTRPLYDVNGKLLGVAGVDLSLEHVRDDMLLPTQPMQGERAFLLDGEGNIILSSDEDIEHEIPDIAANSSKQLTPYDNADIIKEIRTGKTGHRIVESADGDKKLIAYYPLDSIDWYYLRETPYAR
ncbi:MAG: serine/threonine protein kinase [Chromatiales bacterium]|jgi:serine/threonine-protein kinase